jgi:hypothetical protein
MQGKNDFYARADLDGPDQGKEMIIGFEPGRSGWGPMGYGHESGGWNGTDSRSVAKGAEITFGI